MKTFIRIKQYSWEKKESKFIQKWKASNGAVSNALGAFRKGQLAAYNPLENAMAGILKELGISFVRQSIIGSYIVDFLIGKTIIETDGMCHKGRESYDAARDAYLASKGYQVVRFTSQQVFRTPKAVSASLASLLV